jgi:tetratricopeptide (TPR) repeat protein
MPTSERILDLLAAASELAPERRKAYLDSACGADGAVRAEVESLLESHEQAGRFLSEATADLKPGGVGVGGSAGVTAGAAETIATGRHEHYGQMIGRYKLLEVIGEGGFGTVWMAEQREPVKRRVALKIIKLGMDTRQVIARFEAERQALALMDHPSIAKVFDAGSTENGRPYFVMEYIKGVPILEYCDTERLSTDARLQIFAEICQAIQHAHQKGVIHRDIKPGNVLVTMHDGLPVPKVIDFGIAKATSAELTQKTLFTEHRQIIGTPAYMSPEQAEMSGLDIDTRSDIYSLGVLLYELLTGTTPFASKELMSGGFAEMMRIIREVEPQKPSTRLSTLGKEATRTAQQRMASDPRRLASILQGDLDWIVMKCLEKDRTRRYDSASGLAADVRRHLRDEPVSAGAPGAAYRLRKFLKRHRGPVIAASIIVGVLLLGIAGTTLGLTRALNEGARANAAAARATAAAKAEAEAKAVALENERRALDESARAERARAEESRARSRAETITGFVVAALRSGDAQNLGEVQGAGQDMTILAAMDSAVREIQSGRFKNDPETELDLLSTIAQILRNNGRTPAAEPLVTRALELARRQHPSDHAKLAMALEHVAHVREELGRLEEAEPLMREALAMRRRLHRDTDSALAGTLQSLGMLLLSKGELDEASRLCTEALDLSRGLHPGDHTEVAICLNNLALVRQSQGKPIEAQPLFTEALEMHRRLYPGDHPEVAAGLNNLGIVRAKLGDTRAAAELFEQCLAMRERLYRGDHPAVAVALANLAAVLRDLNRLQEAETLARRALEVRRRLYQGDHPVIAASLLTLGTVEWKLGRLDEAEGLFVEALDINRRVSRGDNPDTATVLSSLGLVRREQGRPAASEPLLTEALRMRERLLAGDHPVIVSTLRSLAEVNRELGKSSESAALARRADEMEERLKKGQPTGQRDDRITRAVQLWSRGEFDRSIPLFESLLEEQTRALGPEHPQTRLTAANLGVNYKDAGRIAEAMPLLVAAHHASEQQPDLVFAAPHLLEAYAKSADAASPATVAKAVALVDGIVAAFREEYPARSPQLASVLSHVTHWLVVLKAWDKAEPLASEVLELRLEIQPDAWTTYNSRSLVGAILLGQGKLSEAEGPLRDGYEGLKARAADIPPQAASRLPEAVDRLILLATLRGDAEQEKFWKAERQRYTPAPRAE